MGAIPRHAAGVRSWLAPPVHRLPLLPQVAEARHLGEGCPGPGPQDREREGRYPWTYTFGV